MRLPERIIQQQDAAVSSPAAIRDTVGRLAKAGVGMLFIPTMFLPRDGGRTLDRFIGEIAPALR